jgi:hypothetical protein
MAQENKVWKQAPSVTNADVTFPACPPGIPGPQDNCVKVDVYRNQARGNPLPTFFANLAGVTSQGVRATATAQVVTGDTTSCLRPWAVVDRWNEFGPEGPTPLPTSTYDKYSTGQGNSPPQENDVYIPPSSAGPGTGYSLPADYGRQFAIKMGPTATVCPSSIPNNWTDTAYWAALGCYRVQTGATVGSTRNSIEALMAQDSGASWSNGSIIGSRFDPPASSPRVVPVGVMDIDWYLSQDPTGNNGVLRMVNIFGFFIEGMGNVDRNTGAITLAANGQSVIGRIMTIPATANGNSTLPGSASFLVTVRLVR